MNYLKVYCNLIRKAENRVPPEGYTEKHHTFPKSIFGKNNRVVVLTAREHYISHCLLMKAFIKRYGVDSNKTKKMIYALWCMSNKSKYSNSHIYESLRKQVVKLYTGENNPAKRPEIRQKISQANLGRIHTEETRKNMSKARKGRKLSPRSEETKEKIRIGNTGNKHSQETKDKLSKFNKNKKLSQEQRDKISQSNKGRILSQATRDKIGKAHRGRVHTEETRKNMSEAHKGEKNHKSKWWKITFVDGTEIVICGMNGWAKENGYSYSCVHRVYTGKYKKHKDIIKVEVITKKDP
jgi:hypothetical protein